MKKHFKNWRWIAILLMLCGAIFIFWRYHHLSRFDLIFNEVSQSDDLPLASYHHQGDMAVVRDVQHLQLKLNDSDWNFEAEDFDSDAEVLIISLLPYNTHLTHRFHDGLSSIIDGLYDQRYAELFSLLGQLPNEVYLRFAPEMELPGLSYPWQRYGYLYTSAFRRVGAIADSVAPNLKMMWGPAGYPGVLEFMPDTSLFDAVSITLNSPREMALDAYPNHPGEYQLTRKLHRLRFISKTVFVLSADDKITQEASLKWLQSYHQQSQEIPSVHWRNFQPNSKKPPQLKFGLYDPQLELSQLPPVDAEHIFCDFKMVQDGSLARMIEELRKRDHELILTVEPDLDKDKRQILEEILDGRHDAILQQLSQILADFDQQIYLRFAHEMEIPIKRYPWQSKDPILYIRCYRHFMSFMEGQGLAFSKVWGPAGDRGSVEWYPGDDKVDLISFAVYGLPDKNITDPEKQEKFTTIFHRKMWRFRMIDKPVFITEFGVKGPEDFQKKWLLEAAQTLKDQERIVGVCYFNFSDVPGAWGDIDAPDWRISEETLLSFLRTLGFLGL